MQDCEHRYGCILLRLLFSLYEDLEIRTSRRDRAVTASFKSLCHSSKSDSTTPAETKDAISDLLVFEFNPMRPTDTLVPYNIVRNRVAETVIFNKARAYAHTW